MSVTIQLADIWSTVWILTVILGGVQLWYGLGVYDLLEKSLHGWSRHSADHRMFLHYIIINSIGSLSLAGLTFAIMIHYSNT